MAVKDIMKKAHAGFYFLITLTIILSILRLTRAIKLSWWYITIPIDIIIACVVIILAYAVVLAKKITKL